MKWTAAAMLALLAMLAEPCRAGQITFTATASANDLSLGDGNQDSETDNHAFADYIDNYGSASGFANAVPSPSLGIPLLAATAR